MMKHIIRQQTVSQVVLQPHELDNVHGNIAKKLEQLIGKCDRFGYIVAVSKIDYDTATNVVSRNSGHCVYTITYTRDVFIPKVDDVYNARITHVFKDGIFCKYFDMKILIPCQMTPELEFRHTHFVNRKTNVQYTVGMEVNVQIVMVRYDHRAFQCIGTIQL